MKIHLLATTTGQRDSLCFLERGEGCQFTRARGAGHGHLVFRLVCRSTPSKYHSRRSMVCAEQISPKCPRRPTESKRKELVTFTVPWQFIMTVGVFHCSLFVSISNSFGSDSRGKGDYFGISVISVRSKFLLKIFCVLLCKRNATLKAVTKFKTGKHIDSLQDRVFWKLCRKYHAFN